MKALRLMLVLAATSIGVTESVGAQSADRLRAEIQKAEGFLKRIDDGSSPCFTAECQSQKALLLDRLSYFGETIPGSGVETLKSLAPALEVAHFMVDYPYLPPEATFPETLDQWMYWWKKRYSYEQRYRNEWFALVGEAFALWEALEIHSSRSKGPQPIKNMIQEAWDRGSADIAQLYHRQSWLADRAGVMKTLGKLEESSRLMAEARQVITEREGLEAKFFGGRFRSVMEELYPGIEFKKICAAQARLQFFTKVARSSKIFDRDVLEELNYWKGRLKSLNSIIKEYSDLEYGVVGLKNFDSMINQAQAVEYEIIIQDFLDKVDLSGRVGASIGASYLMSFLLSATAYSNLIFFGTNAGLNYASAQYDFDFTEYLWAKSNRTTELESLLPTLREDMERRLSDLMRARTALAAKIREMKEQLNALEKGTHS